MSLSTAAWSEDNTYNLSRIYVGMSEEQVLKIMRHPYSQRTFEHNGDVYDVWFYVTRMTVMDQSRMVPQNLTPLTFKNGVLIGWGFSHYNYLLKQEAISEQIKNDAVRQKKAEEDAELEKALEAPSGMTPAGPNTPQVPTKPGQPAPQTQPAKAPTQRPPAPAQQQPATPPNPALPSPNGKPVPSQPAPANPAVPPSTPQAPSENLPLPQPPPPPVQSLPQQPPGPVQPGAPGSKPTSMTSGTGLISMCSRPTPAPLPVAPDETQEAPEKSSSPKDPYLDEGDRKMLEEENEENFDFW